MDQEGKRTIGVLFGGRSLEHDVSVVSGLQIVHALDPGEFAPLPIYVNQSNRWWTGPDLWHTKTFKSTRFDDVRSTEVALSPRFGSSSLVPVKSIVGTAGDEIAVDVFIPVLHGTYGEDGCVQGLLELGCAYVGSGVLASAAGMNKRVTKVLASQCGVPVVPWLSCSRDVLEQRGPWASELSARVAQAFGWPAIVKPCNLGSSAGVSIAHDEEELVAGVLNVFEYDLEALIEPFITNRLELNVAVAGLDEPVASITEMPVTAQASPLSFGEK